MFLDIGLHKHKASELKLQQKTPDGLERDANFDQSYVTDNKFQKIETANNRNSKLRFQNLF